MKRVTRRDSLTIQLGNQTLTTNVLVAKTITIDVMSCFKGDFIHQRLDSVQDTFGKLNEVCNDEEIQPTLPLLTGKNRRTKQD